MSSTETPTSSVIDLSGIFEKQRKVALAVSSKGGTANASEINDRVDFNSSLIRNHAKQLIKKGLLRDTGRRIDVGPGMDAIEYELTDEGKAAVSRYRGLAEGLTTEARLEVMENNLQELRQDHEELEGRFETLLERIAESDQSI